MAKHKPEFKSLAEQLAELPRTDPSAADKSLVVFGSAFIYHKFPDKAEAEKFAAAVTTAVGWNTKVYEDGGEAGAEALYPFELTAPVVLVDRTGWGSMKDEEYFAKSHKVDQLCRQFCGEFAGT